MQIRIYWKIIFLILIDRYQDFLIMRVYLEMHPLQIKENYRIHEHYWEIGLLKAFFIVFTYSNYYPNKYGLLQ